MIFRMPLEADICECQNIVAGMERSATNKQFKAPEIEIQLLFLRDRLERLPLSNDAH